MAIRHQNRTAQATSVSVEALHYSLSIEWDPRDEIYVVTVPELPGCRTHGATYAEAVAMAQDAIDGWATVVLEDGRELPVPSHYADRGW